MAGITLSDFKDTFNQDDACYIYYLDEEARMHFLSDADSVDFDASDLRDAIYTDHAYDAALCTYEQAKTLVFLCDYLFDNKHHIVRVHTHVEWL